MRKSIIEKTKRIKSFCLKHQYGSLFTAGALSALPFVIGELFLFSYIFLVFFYCVLFYKTERAFKKAFAYFFGYYVGAYQMFLSLYPLKIYKFNKAESIIVIVLIWITVAFIHSLLSSFIMMWSVKITRKGTLRPFVCASLFVIVEWVNGIGGFAFPWAKAALSQSFFLIEIQTVSLFGCFFITLVLSVTSFSFAEWLLGGKKFLPYFAIFVFLVNIICGTVLYYVPVNSNGILKTAIVQGNIASNEKWETENIRQIFDIYVNMTKQAANDTNADVILLPESAIPVYFHKDGAVHDSFAEIAEEYDTTVVFGSLFKENSKYYNSVIAVFPDGSLSERYDKQKLVPIIESIPYNDFLRYSDILDLLPFFDNFDFESNSYQAGSDDKLITLSDGTLIAPGVCFDSAFSYIFRTAVKNGASFLAIVSNDSWYYDGPEVYQHRDIAVIRSIETGRYTLRAANTGISCIIDNKGRIITQTEPLTKSIISSEIELIERKTLYTYIGDVPLYFSFALIIILLFFKLLKQRRIIP